MLPLRRTGTIAAAGLIAVFLGSPRCEGYPWPWQKRQVMVVPQAGQAPAFGAAPIYGPAPAIVAGSAPAATYVVPGTTAAGLAPTTTLAGSAPATTYIISGATTAGGSAPAAGYSPILVNGQPLNFGLAASSSSNRCEITPEDQQAIIDDLRSYNSESLKGMTSFERRRDLIEQAMTMLEEICDSADEPARKTLARQLVNQAQASSGTDAGLAASGYLAVPGGYTQPQVVVQGAPLVGVAPQPLYQPVVPVLIQPSSQHKCWRCMHKVFCPHKAHP